MPAAVRSGAGASAKMARGNSKVRPVYRCEQCDYDTTHKGHLMEHQRTHTGERPHKCTMCKYTGSSKGHLASHMRKKHPEYKPYKCNQCDFVGNFSRDLVAHRWKHTGEQPIFCTECDYATPCKANMTAHYKRKHPGKRPTKSVRPSKTIPRSSEAVPLPSSSTRSPMPYTLYPSPPSEVETTVEYPSSTSGTSEDYASRSNSPAMSNCDSPFFNPANVPQQQHNEFNFYDEQYNKKPLMIENVMSHEEFQNKLPAFATFSKTDMPNYSSVNVKRETSSECELSNPFQTDVQVHPGFDASWWQSSVLTPPAEEFQPTSDHFSLGPCRTWRHSATRFDDPYSIHDSMQLPQIAKTILRDFDPSSHFVPVNTERHSSRQNGSGRPYSPYDEIDVLELERYL
ncbi:PREDICTED: zinc finger protein 577-like [Branchiostoma belcheri]|uniref:Zinc finger protein 577-like n=1 Tax=Branchiostoma belcheri TaxID=7741 RepID=A0A6P4Z0W0_BRABE|nr:PREDICTED: zinc finger protein 577-like [Branchiostoma belcheri]